jgi:hypothetical protein
MGSVATPNFATAAKVNLDNTSQLKNYDEMYGSLHDFKQGGFGGYSPQEIGMMQSANEKNIYNATNAGMTNARNTAAGNGLSPNAVINAGVGFANKAIDSTDNLNYNITKDNRTMVEQGRQSWLNKMMELSQQVQSNASGQFAQNQAVTNQYSENDLNRYKIDKANETNWGSIIGSLIGEGSKFLTGGMASHWGREEEEEE